MFPCFWLNTANKRFKFENNGNGIFNLTSFSIAEGTKGNESGNIELSWTVGRTHNVKEFEVETTGFKFGLD